VTIGKDTRLCGLVWFVWARPNRFFPMLLVGVFSDFEDAVAFGREASYNCEGTLVEFKELR
jgi:hypothetical protein